MIAIEKFKQGDRVKLSQNGLEADLICVDSPEWRATVVGFSHDVECVRVRRDGRSTPHKFHIDFLDLA